MENYQDVIALLYRIPSSLNKALNQGYFDELIKVAMGLENELLQIKILSMVLERADPARKLEIRSMLLQKIMYLSQKIAAGASSTMKTVVTQFRPGLDEIDVDKTIEEQIGHTVLEYQNIYCRERIKQKSAYVLMLDVSNSMHQEKVAIATIATGVFSRKLKNDFQSVLAFASDTNIIKRVHESNDLEELMNRMLNIKSGGGTNIRKALLDGLSLLDESKAKLKKGIIVTDGMATAGGDPVEIASQYDRLHVLEISFGRGRSDPATNTLMAQKGRGKYMYVHKFDDLPLSISQILTKN